MPGGVWDWVRGSQRAWGLLASSPRPAAAATAAGTFESRFLRTLAHGTFTLVVNIGMGQPRLAAFHSSDQWLESHWDGWGQRAPRSPHVTYSAGQHHYTPQLPVIR